MTLPHSHPAAAAVAIPVLPGVPAGINTADVVVQMIRRAASPGFESWWLGLRWVDVDLVNGRVVITKALSRVGTNLALRDVKTESSAASVPLPGELVAILRRHRRDQFGDAQVARANTLGLVFTTKNGTPLEPRNVNRAFEALCRRADVRSIRLHDLRHSCATLLFAMGVEAATVQRILRHSSISVTTGTYVDVIEQVQRAAVSGMDSLLCPAR